MVTEPWISPPLTSPPMGHFYWMSGREMETETSPLNLDSLYLQTPMNLMWAISMETVSLTSLPDTVTVTAFIGNGDGTFRMQPILSGSSTIIYQGISLADFNGDGKTDIEVTRTSYNSLGGVDEDLLILLANGDGTFITRTFTQIGNYLSATADFNGDGVPDLVLPKGQRQSYVCVWKPGI